MAASFGRRLARLRAAFGLAVAFGAVAVLAAHRLHGAAAALLAFLASAFAGLVLLLAYHYSSCPACGEQFFVAGRPGTAPWAVSATMDVAPFRSRCINCGLQIRQGEDARR